jgi:hypothetical protein
MSKEYDNIVRDAKKSTNAKDILYKVLSKEKRL